MASATDISVTINVDPKALDKWEQHLDYVHSIEDANSRLRSIIDCIQVRIENNCPIQEVLDLCAAAKKI